MIEILQSSGVLVPLRAGDAKKFRGTRLPGADLWEANPEGAGLSIHLYRAASFGLSLRSIQVWRSTEFMFREPGPFMRMEIVLMGELEIEEENGVRTKLLAGQYCFHSSEKYRAMFSAGIGCRYLVLHLGQEFTEPAAIRNQLQMGVIRNLSLPMREMIDKLLANPFENTFRDLFYDNGLRELLFRHASLPPHFLPGELTPAMVAAVHEADHIIAANLNKHYTIHQLARMVRTNVFTLKTAFVRVMGVGMFERLHELKMERAKELLSSTDLQIQEVADMAGYETVTGFINSFRKQFGMSPKDWRKKSRGG